MTPDEPDNAGPGAPPAPPEPEAGAQGAPPAGAEDGKDAKAAQDDAARRAEPPKKAAELKVDRTRVSAAWGLVAAALVFLVLILVFIIQNDRQVDVEFLWLDFRVRLGVAMLFSVVAGAAAVAALGIARITQLRLLARRHRKADRRARR